MLKFMLLSTFSYVVPAGSEVISPGVDRHNVDEWKTSEQIELSDAVVDGLAATQLKVNLKVKPKTTMINFKFWSVMTRYLRENIRGLKTVRLASIILHYKPHTDSCRGETTYMLVDRRFTDEVSIAKTVDRNGILRHTGEVRLVGKIYQSVTFDCSREALVQFSMNYFVTPKDLEQIQLFQVVNNLNMVQGDLATLSIGWKTIPGEATVYKPHKAQLYLLPRLRMPELMGKGEKQVYNTFVSMAKARRDKEAQLLKNLEDIVQSSNAITNKVEVNLEEELSNVDSEIKALQGELEKLDNAMPNKRQLEENKKVLNELKLLKEKKIHELQFGPSSSNDSQNTDLNIHINEKYSEVDFD